MIAIQKLKEAEVVLMNKIKRMKDGKPKWNASAELEDLRRAITILTRIDAGLYEIKSTTAHQPY